MRILGIVLSMAGVAAFFFQLSTRAASQTNVHIRPVAPLEQSERQSLPVAPILAGLLLLGGAVLVVVGEDGEE